MATKDLSTYTTHIGVTQDNDTLFVRSTGQFQFVSDTLNGTQLEAWMKSQYGFQTIQNATSVLSTKVLIYGVNTISCNASLDNGSATFPSAIKGARCIVNGALMSAACSVYISNTAGDVIVGLGSAAATAVSLSTTGIVEMRCHVEGTWAVAAQNASADAV